MIVYPAPVAETVLAAVGLAPAPVNVTCVDVKVAVADEVVVVFVGVAGINVAPNNSAVVRFLLKLTVAGNVLLVPVVAAAPGAFVCALQATLDTLAEGVRVLLLETTQVSEIATVAGVPTAS